MGHLTPYMEKSLEYAEQNLLNETARHLHLDKAFIRANYNLNGARVLDFGCGMGGMTLWYAQNWNCWVEGIDLDRSHIAVAQELQKRHDIQNAYFFCCDLLETELPGNYDYIFLNDVAEHIPYPILEAIFQKLTGYLAPGGRIFVSYPPWQGPYASHVTRVTHLPWCQFLPQKLLLDWVKRKNIELAGENESNLLEAYLGLNHLTHARLMRTVKPAGLRPQTRISHSILKRIPLLKYIPANLFPFNLLVSKEILVLTK